MAFKRFDKDVSHVSKLPDIPSLENGYTPKALKERFDMAGEDIKEYINESLINELEGEGGADSIGIKTSDALSGTTVQDGLLGLSERIRDIANAQIPDGTVTPDKFVPSVASFIKEGSHKMRLFATPGEELFTPTRSCDYKVTVQGAGGGGSTYSLLYISCGGGSGALASGVFRLEAGHEYKIKVGHGGSGVLKDESGKLLSRAECGEPSGFYDGDTELLYAEGGKVGIHIDGEAEARGGILCKGGGFPLMRFPEGESSASLEIGAGSDFASATSNKSLAAGLGAGGYGAKYSINSSVYTREGGQGGNGCVLIEWVE